MITFGTVFLVPVFTQQVQGHTALATGVALLPQGVVMGLGTVLGQRLSARTSLRTLVTGGFVVLALSSTVMLLLTETTPLWVTALMLCGRTAAAGLVTTPLLVAFLAPLDEGELADGNTLYSITQRLGASVGVSILGSIAASGTGPVGTLDAFHLVGAILVGLAVAAAGLAWWLPRPTPDGRLSGGLPATTA